MKNKFTKELLALQSYHPNGFYGYSNGPYCLGNYLTTTFSKKKTLELLSVAPTLEEFVKLANADLTLMSALEKRKQKVIADFYKVLKVDLITFSKHENFLQKKKIQDEKDKKRKVEIAQSAKKIVVEHINQSLKHPDVSYVISLSSLSESTKKKIKEALQNEDL